MYLKVKTKQPHFKLIRVLYFFLIKNPTKMSDCFKLSQNVLLNASALGEVSELEFIKWEITPVHQQTRAPRWAPGEGSGAPHQ